MGLNTNNESSSDYESDDDIGYLTLFERKLCKKVHVCVDITAEEWSKDPYNKDPGGNLLPVRKEFKRVKCMDCDEMYNDLFEEHCCCRCDSCGRKYINQYDGHDCSIIMPNYCRKQHNIVKLDKNDWERVFPSIKTISEKSKPEIPEETSAKYSKCLDCDEIYRSANKEHCCCKCCDCGKPYGDPYKSHSCDGKGKGFNPTFCRKNNNKWLCHDVTDVTAQEWKRLHKIVYPNNPEQWNYPEDPLERKDGWKYVVCNDCGEMFNPTYQSHCCCKCPYCHEMYKDPYRGHDCIYFTKKY